MFENEETSAGSNDESEENSASEGNKSEADEEDDEADSGAIPNLNIKGPGKVNVRNSKGVKIGNTINMTLKVDKMIVQNEANQQHNTAAIAGTQDKMLQEMIENVVTKHLQNLIGDNAASILPIQSKARVSHIEDISNVESNEDYLIEEPPDENIEPRSLYQRINQNNDVDISENVTVDENDLSFKTKETLVLKNKTDESSDIDRNMAAPEINQYDYNTSPMSRSVEETVPNSSQTEEIVLNASQTEELCDKELLLKYFLQELVGYINVNCLSEIELGDCDKVLNDNINDPFGYKVDMRFRGGRLLDFTTLYIKLVKQFEITVNSVIIVIELAFSKLEYSFNEFSIYWNMNLPRANIYTIKGNATASVPDNSITIKLVFMYSSIDNAKPLIKLVEDPNLGKVNLNVIRYPDEDHNRNNNSMFLDCLKFYLSYEYLSNIKQSIVDTLNNALDHLVTSDNNFKLTIVQILNYLDYQDFPFK